MPILNEKEYECDACHRVFEKGWTDEEAKAEQDRLFPNLKPEDQAVICDTCHKIMMSIPDLPVPPRKQGMN